MAHPSSHPALVGRPPARDGTGARLLGELKGVGGSVCRVEAIAFVIGVVLMVVGLAVSIALHELGHLVPAKKFGVRVGQYMIGFGPTLWSRKDRRDPVRIQGDSARRLHLHGGDVPALTPKASDERSRPRGTAPATRAAASSRRWCRMPARRTTRP